jgi:hypothetical protein
MVELCSRCFKSLCSHKAEKFDCDDMMVYPIQKLNGLGYKTLYSCSGHLDRGITYDDEGEAQGKVKDSEPTVLQTYIMFDKMYHFDVMPSGFDFKFNVHNKSWAMESIDYCLEGNSEQRHQHIVQSLCDLTNWLVQLKKWDGKLYEVSK